MAPEQRYEVVPMEDEVGLLESKKEVSTESCPRCSSKSVSAKRPFWWVQWAAHAGLILFYILFLRSKAHPSKLTCEVSISDIGAHTISYKLHSFDEGHGENVKFTYPNGTEGKRRDYYYASGPNKMVDKTWEKLYDDVMFMRITKEEAERLPSKTEPLDDGSGYLSGLDVFHQLHCLDAIRKGYEPDYMGTFNNREHFTQHLGHCINYIRQAIVCNADITALSFYEITDPEDPGFERYGTKFGNPHVCRDFQAVYDFAYARRIRKDEEARLLDKDRGIKGSSEGKQRGHGAK